MEELSNNEMLNVCFNGIEMRGLNEKSNLPDISNLERIDIPTSKGINLTVYAQKGKNAKSMSIVTFHDIGSNYKSFYSFFNYPEMKVIAESFTIYHVCAPGHVPDAPPSNDESKRLLSASAGDVFSVTTTREKRYSVTENGIAAYPSLEELAEMIQEVVERLDLRLVLLMGCGAGSNVLSRMAMHPEVTRRLLGAVLVNPEDGQSSTWQWAKLRWADLPKLKPENAQGFMTDGLQDFLLNHWFGFGARELMQVEYGAAMTMDLEEHMLQSVKHMDTHSVAGFIDSYLCRSNLGLSRPDKTLPCDALLLTGDFAKDLSRAMCEMNGNLDPTKTQFISVPDSTGMVIEESPDKVAPVFLNYLRNLGIMVSVTPEKLKRMALDVQIQAAQIIYDNCSDGSNINKPSAVIETHTIMSNPSASYC